MSPAVTRGTVTHLDKNFHYCGVVKHYTITMVTTEIRYTDQQDVGVIFFSV